MIKNCNTCKYLLNEVCVNCISPMCADYPNLEMMCFAWVSKVQKERHDCKNNGCNADCRHCVKSYEARMEGL